MCNGGRIESAETNFVIALMGDGQFLKNDASWSVERSLLLERLMAEARCGHGTWKLRFVLGSQVENRLYTESWGVFRRFIVGF